MMVLSGQPVFSREQSELVRHQARLGLAHVSELRHVLT